MAINPEETGSCWKLWHEILNLAGRGDTLEWVPLYHHAWEHFPKSRGFQAKLLLGIYSWYTADAPVRAWVFRQIEQHARAGVAWAICKMGSAYYHGLEVERNWVKACYWFSRAAEEEQAEAQCRLAGLLYRGGINFKDTKAALNLYLRVATKSYSAWRYEARLACAEIYAFGIGVPEDPYIARYLLRPMLSGLDRAANSDRALIIRIAKRLGTP